jgi:chemotaxis regulatin CheY-phosphate phosphatase CheZ
MGREVGGATAKRTPPGQKACGCESHSFAAEITALVNTLRELAAIRATAEDAASRILDSAEGLLALADKEEAKKAEDAILSIMTACGFHDLVGQRVTKITQTLDRVIAGRLNGDDTPGPSQAPPSEIALEGPALPAGKADQAQIDALFSEKN